MNVLCQAIGFLGAIGFALGAIGCSSARSVDSRSANERSPFLIVLGIAQDGGVPQAGSFDEPGRHDASKRKMVSCLGLVDLQTGKHWLFDATPDFPAQLTLLHDAGAKGKAPDGIFLTHAHIGHYTGLMYLGHEAMGTQGVKVYAAPRMRSFLESNGPWDQLVRYHNMKIESLTPGEPVRISEELRVTPFPVPHRQEYSEVLGFRIDGPGRSVLFIPDIDSWDDLDATGVRIEDLIAGVDVAYLDGTFFGEGEIPGRSMKGIPHPMISSSLERFKHLPPSERAKVRFIHLNHTNPVLDPASDAARQVSRAGMNVAQEGEVISLDTAEGSARANAR
ncbi:MAG: MBL fold metallo-hydrolase [Phycisphaeraceae bacterium]|nr:MBL fold metallo-hydrolase [Phycisphaeraceae bacterium]